MGHYLSTRLRGVTPTDLERMDNCPERTHPARISYPPMFTVGEPALIWPTPPQCLVMSLARIAGLPLMLTVAEPFCAVQVFGPQQTA